MKITRKLSLFLLITILLSLICACGDNAEAPTDERYFTGDALSDWAALEAFVYDMSDGSIIVACPDPLCPHTPDQENCPFAGSYTDCAAVTENRIYYMLGGKKGGDTGSVYMYDITENKTKLIYKYEADYAESEHFDFLAGGGKLYFNAPEIKIVDGVTVVSRERRVMCYDPQSNKTTEFGRPEEDDFIRCVSDGYLIFQRGGTFYRTKGGFDNCEPILPPDGGKVGMYDYLINLEPGVMAKCYYPQDVYLYDEDRHIDLPDLGENSIIYTPVRSGDGVCYQLSPYRSEYVKEGDTEFYLPVAYNTEPNADGEYEVTVYITNGAGKSVRYDIASKYSLILKKAYGSRALFDIWSIYENGEKLEPNNGRENLIWIDLDTGKAIIYDHCAARVFDVTLGETTVKVTKSEP
jgi:hypothetical protein